MPFEDFKEAIIEDLYGTQQVALNLYNMLNNKQYEMGKNNPKYTQLIEDIKTVKAIAKSITQTIVEIGKTTNMEDLNRLSDAWEKDIEMVLPSDSSSYKT